VPDSLAFLLTLAAAAAAAFSYRAYQRAGGKGASRDEAHSSRLAIGWHIA